MIKVMIGNTSLFLRQVLLLFAYIFSSGTSLYGQSGNHLTLEDCYHLAKANYPLIKQFELIEKTKGYLLENASKGTLPHLQITGQATYQSDVTDIPISLPNLKLPALSKDQYRLYGEISQPLTDLFIVKQQQELIDANSKWEKEKVEVELHKLKERINQLYFGILVINAQITQISILKKDILEGIIKTNVAIANGVALKSSVDLLKAELLKTEQRAIDLEAAKKGYIDMLGAFIHQDINEHTEFETPTLVLLVREINRPEIEMFEMQKRTFDVQNKLSDAKLFPRFSLFLQGGYGRPGLDMLSNQFDLYYIGGVRVQWNITGFYTNRNEKQLLSINQRSLDVQKEIFLINTDLQLKQQDREIKKLEKLMETDNEIIQLRENVKLSAQSKLANGTATVNDYLSYVNAEVQAKQNLALHKIQLLMAKYNYKTTSGN